MSGEQDPHRGQRIVAAGRKLEEAKAAMILVHGRGASAESILQLADELDRPDFCFLAPLEQNEPYLSSALRHRSHGRG